MHSRGGGKYNAFNDDDYSSQSDANIVNGSNNRGAKDFDHESKHLHESATNNEFGDFANFDDFSNHQHSTHEETNSQRGDFLGDSNHTENGMISMTNGNRRSNHHGDSQYKSNSYSSPSKHNHQKPQSSTKAKMDGNSYAYDSEAASDYKWAKMEATNTLTKSIEPIHHKESEPSTNKIRLPTNNSLLRSMSNTRSVGGGDSGERYDSRHRNSSSNARRRERSITPHRERVGEQSSTSSSNFRTRQRSRSPANSNDNHQRDTTPARENGKKTRSKHNNSRPNMLPSRRVTTTASSSRSKQSPQNNEQQQYYETKEEKRLRKYYASKNYTFQHPHAMLTYKIIDLETRIAFEKPKRITMADLEAAVRKEGESNNVSSSTIQNRMKKLSPSPQYVELMNMMGQVKTTKQLCWSPSISREADPFYGWDNNSDEDDDNDKINDESIEKTSIALSSSQIRTAEERDQRRKLLLKRKRKKVAAQNAKYRYKQIDAQEYLQKTLLDHSPLLTNVRRRLPMRSDVGFPNATEEEIILKQSEVAKEAQLEEISPRLIVMLRGDDIGAKPDLDVDSIMDKKVLEKLKYKLPGMPYAGRELTIAKHMQKKSVVLKNESANNDATTSTSSGCRKVKPDPNSLFAPSVDAVLSSSELWRPRPFFDRPAGMAYAMAIPVNMSFAPGNIEPLICTLALYSLPKESIWSGGKSPKLKGKISEDFIFPAGEWGDDLLEEKAGEILAKQFGMEKELSGSKGKNRMRKALFSFLPSDLPNYESDGMKSLYLVMNVHKVTHKDAGMAYINSISSKNLLSGKNTISSLFFGSSGNSTTTSSRYHEIANAKARAETAFDAFGSQFVTPFCFGMIPLFPIDPESNARSEEAFEWPNGISQNMLMFAHPTKAESQDAFVDRLMSLSHRTNTNSNIIDEINCSLSHSDSSFDDDSNIIAIASEDSRDSRGKVTKRKRPKFKFRRRKAPKSALTYVEELIHSDAKLIDASAIFYTSKVGADFSQALLQQPSFLRNEKIRGSRFPQMLVDVSGDAAIMVNPELTSSTRKRRSNLIRLPSTTKSAAYSDSCEIREVLYLPFQSDSKFDTAPYLSPRTSINLLYIYPRLIQKVSSLDSAIDRSICYSVRIRLVKQKVNQNSGTFTSTYTPTDSMYNTSPGGESIVQAIYTKIPIGCTGKNNKTDISKGVPLQDEIKVRLPLILDGSYFLNFTLYAIHLEKENQDSGGLVQNIVGETYIPLSSSNTKESISGKKVTTIIPNGMHRIKIGDFQVQVASRLVSTIHVFDPSVAAAVRDFDTSFDRMGHAQVTNMLSKATDLSSWCHFYPLAYLHLRELIKPGHIAFDLKKGKLTSSDESMIKMEYLRSFMKLVEKAKKKFMQLEHDYGTELFIKTFLDMFDEGSFNDNIRKQNLSLTGPLNSISNLSLESDQEVEPFDDNGSEQRPPNNEEEKYMKYNYVVDVKSLHERYADNAVPFSRKAYGVSKIDRMKAEAEMYEAGQNMMSELFDDDETVVTASTWQSNPHVPMTTANSFPISRPSTVHSIFKGGLSNDDDDTNIMNVTNEVEEVQFSSPYEKARSMAIRVNRVAKIFTAPCIAPELNEGALHSPVRRNLGRIKKERIQTQGRPGSLIDEYNRKESEKQKQCSGKVSNNSLSFI